jgi:hypothetical protein
MEELMKRNTGSCTWRMAHFLLLNDCRAMAWVYVGYAVRLGYIVRSSLHLLPSFPCLRTHHSLYSQIGLCAPPFPSFVFRIGILMS